MISGPKKCNIREQMVDVAVNKESTLVELSDAIAIIKLALSLLKHIELE